MRAVEEAYPGYPDSMRELMERAGTATAEAALRRFPDAKAYTVVCGGGSNGGDGLVAADALRSRGREVRVVEAKSGEKELGNPDVIVDALFGTGFSGAPRADAAALIEQMNAAGAPMNTPSLTVLSFREHQTNPIRDLPHQDLIFLLGSQQASILLGNQREFDFRKQMLFPLHGSLIGK